MKLLRHTRSSLHIFKKTKKRKTNHNKTSHNKRRHKKRTYKRKITGG